jgi:hypothetical protein
MVYEYLGKDYDIRNLKRNSSGDLTKVSQRVLKSYQKSLRDNSPCLGFLTYECSERAQPGKRGRCGACYNKDYQQRHATLFISDVFGIPDMYTSSLNPAIYSSSKCIETGCSLRAGISYPYCSTCDRSLEHSLKVYYSRSWSWSLCNSRFSSRSCI